MSRDDGAAGTPADPASAAEVRLELRRMLLLNRTTFVVGTLACVLTLVALAHPYLPPGRLAVWAVAGVLAAAGFGAALWPPLVHRSDASGLPLLLAPTGYACGVVFGASAWIDLDALRDGPYAWICAVMLMAMSSGTQSGLVNGTSHLRRVVVPMWVLAGAAYAVAGRTVVTAAAAVYLVIIVRDSFTSGRFVVAGVAARVAAARAAVTDSLTGLPNRAGALAEIAALARAHPAAGPFDVVALYVDLDGFKPVNDTHGHLAGDAVLVETARRLRAHCRTGDLAARLGGDEFLVLMVERAAAPVDTRALGARLVAALEEPVAVPGASVSVSASIGVARVPGVALDADDLVGRADAALYAAKRAGRRRVVHFAGDRVTSGERGDTGACRP